jgi:hypothetical protein
MLKDHADRTARLAQAALVQRRDIGAIDDDVTAARTLQPVDQPNKRRFARAALADDADDRAFGHFERDAGKRRHFRCAVP